MRQSWPWSLSVTLWVTLQQSALAAGIPTLEAVVIKANNHALIGTADTATEGTVTAAQIKNRPLLRPAEVIESIPGLIVTQHSGDGKANQYFLRGFNLDHGSDFATYLLGMPVNVASHGHGQGYMDLNFLMPELVSAIRYRKGVYAPEDGDFGSTGSARIHYIRELAHPFVSATVGSHNYQRLLAAGSQTWQDKKILVALETVGNDGPWDQPEQLRKINGLLRLSAGDTANGYTLSVLGYQSHWQATEHVPESAIRSGEIGRYGTLLPHDGGITHRYSVLGDWAQTGDNTSWRVNAWLNDYGLSLFSSPSGYINGAQGDQHEQLDERKSTGGQVEHRWLPHAEVLATEWLLGAQWKYDDVSNVGLYHTVNRVRTETVREDAMQQLAVAAYAEAKTQWTPRLRSSVGVRHDIITADVSPLNAGFNQQNGGHAKGHLTSPKLGLVFTPASKAEFYLNWGQGFHSNDARGATAQVNPNDGSLVDKVPLIVLAKGSEIGMRLAPLAGWNTSLSFWQMKLSSELVFVGDEGVTEPRGGSTRHGVEWANYYQLTPHVIIDGDIAISKARFRAAENGGTHVPNAIPVTASFAVSYDPQPNWSTGLRLRYLGSYDLEETGSEKSKAFWTANWHMSHRLGKAWQTSLDVLNLLNTQANDIEYWGAACSFKEGFACNNGQGIDGRLIHPLEPRAVRVGVRYEFL